MACGYCGERLISKTSEGLSCCGCGRPLAQTRPEGKRALSAKTLMLFGLWVMAALPFVGAIAVTDEMRSAVLAPEGSKPQETQSPE